MGGADWRLVRIYTSLVGSAVRCSHHLRIFRLTYQTTGHLVLAWCVDISSQSAAKMKKIDEIISIDYLRATLNDSANCTKERKQGVQQLYRIRMSQQALRDCNTILRACMLIVKYIYFYPFR